MSNDVDLLFAPEEPESVVPAAKPWHIVVIDDDQEVLEVTRYALEREPMLGRPVKLTYVNSAMQAREVLPALSDVAVILLDVVMESEEAGLRLVRFIRQECNWADVRIILRTGQPGYAPELSVIRDFDINDYRTKSELTHTRLITAVTSAVRAYDQLKSLSDNRRSLEIIVEASHSLLQAQVTARFADCVLEQISTLFGQSAAGVMCVQRFSYGPADHERWVIAGATGPFESLAQQPLENLSGGDAKQRISQTLAAKDHDFGAEHTVLYLDAGQHSGALYLEVNLQAAASMQMARVFAANLSACFGNVRLIEALEYTAYFDQITGLFNRAGLLRALEQQLQHGGHGTDRVLALVDIQRFSDIDDAFGLDFGNEVLRAVAGQLLVTSEPLAAARIAPDVFALYGNVASLLPERLRNDFLKPLHVGEHELPVGIVIGYCRELGVGDTPLSLLNKASIALNRVKRESLLEYEFYAEAMEFDTRWRLDVIRHLRTAMDQDKLEVHYQPQVNMDDGKCVALEALLRWPGAFGHPPAVFIPLAEYAGMILPLGQHVLERALRDARVIHDAGYPLRLAVNVSLVQMRTPEFAESVAKILTRLNYAPELLELEITESVAMDEPRVVLERLQQLKELGVQLALDDFGTGYSSMSYLNRLPFDRIKVDRSFVANIDGRSGGEIANTIINLGHQLHKIVIAEGIETDAQAAFLRAAGCDEGQGYFWAPPMPLEELLVWLNDKDKPFPSKGPLR